MEASHDGSTILRHDRGVDLDVVACELGGRGVLLIHRSVPVLDVGNRGLKVIDGAGLDAVECIVRSPSKT